MKQKLRFGGRGLAFFLALSLPLQTPVSWAAELPDAPVSSWEEEAGYAQEDFIVQDDYPQEFSLPDESAWEAGEEDVSFPAAQESGQGFDFTAGTEAWDEEGFPEELVEDVSLSDSVFFFAGEEAQAWEGEGEEFVSFSWDDDEEEDDTPPPKKEDREEYYDFDADFGKLTLHAGRYTNETIWWDGEKIGGRENVREIVAEPGVVIVTATGLFQNLSNCYLIDLSGADTSAVGSFYQMFAGCTSLQEVNLSSFNTERATRMDYMFWNCESLSTLDLSSFNVESARQGRGRMFSGCGKLSRLTLPEDFDVNTSLELNNGYGGKDGLGWVVEMGDKQVQSQTGTYAVLNPAPNETTTFTWKAKEDGHAYYAPEWEWDIQLTGRGDAMSVTAKAKARFRCMFCEDVQEVQGTIEQETKENHYMVLNATAVLKEVPYTSRRIIYREQYYMDDIRPGVLILDYGKFDKNTINWDADWLRTPVRVYAEEEEKEYIEGREGVRYIEAGPEAVFVGDCTGLFSGLPSLEEVSLYESQVQDGADLTRFLADCPSLKHVYSLPGRGEGSPQTLDDMFAGDTALESINFLGFQTSKAESLVGFCRDCPSLESLDLGPLSFQSARTLSSAFEGCTGLKRVKGFPSDSGSCTDFTSLFENCTSLKEIDVSDLNLSSAYTLERMFAGCESLEGGNGFEKMQVKTVEYCSEIFKDCFSLRELDLSSWNVRNIYRGERMFENCRSLRELHLFDQVENLSLREPYFDQILRGCENLSSLYIASDQTEIEGTLGLNLGDPDRPGWTFEGSDGRVYSEEYTYLVNREVIGVYACVSERVMREQQKYHLIWKSIYNHAHTYLNLAWEWEEDYSSAKAVKTCACGARAEYPATVRISEEGAVKDILLKAKVDGKWNSLKLTELSLPFSFRDGVLTLKAGRILEKPEGVTGWETLLEKYKKNPANLTYDEKETVARYLSWWEEIEREKVTSIYAEEGVKLVGNMDSYFAGLPNLREADLSGADVSGVTSAKGFLADNPGLIRADLSGWSFEEADASSFFAGCTSLAKAELPALFAPTYARELFKDCASLPELDITSLKTSNFSSLQDAFTGCRALKSLTVPAGFAVMGFMGLPNTESRWVVYGDNGRAVSGQEETASMAAVKQVTRFVWRAGYIPTYVFEEKGKTLRMTWGTYSFDTIDWGDYRSAVENVIIEKQVVLTGSCSGFFAGCESLKSVNLQNADCAGVTDASEFFKDCTSLERAELRRVDFSSVQFLSQMFENCGKLAFLDFTDLKLGTVFTMRGMFNGCSSLTELDLSAFDGSLVENISQMFGNCVSLRKLALPDFSAGLLRNMSSAFDGCTVLSELDLSRLNTSRVENMNAAFAACAALKELDLSSLDLGSVRKMNALCKDCTGLEILRLPALSEEAGASFEAQQAFSGDTGIKRLDLGAHFPITLEMALPNAAVSSRGFVIEGGNGAVASGTGDLAQIPAADRRLIYVWRLGYQMPYSLDRESGTLTLKAGAFHKDSILWEEGAKAEVKKIVCTGTIYLEGDCSGFFAGFSALTELDLSTFDFARMTEAKGLLSGLTSLETIILPRNFAVTEQMELPNHRGESLGGYGIPGGESYVSGDGPYAVLPAGGSRSTYLYHPYPFYRNEEGKMVQPKAAPRSAGGTLWQDGFFYAEGTAAIDAPVTVQGEVTLLLLDGSSLTCSRGMTLAEGSSLTVYAGEDGTGSLMVKKDAVDEGGALGAVKPGSLILEGGNLTVQAGDGTDAGKPALTADTVHRRGKAEVLGSLGRAGAPVNLTLGWRDPENTSFSALSFYVKQFAAENNLVTSLSPEEPLQSLTGEALPGRSIYPACRMVFDSAGGSPVEERAARIGNGEGLPAPETPEREGYDFVSWTEEGEEYDFTAPERRAEILLTARWKEKDPYFTSFALELGGQLGLLFYMSLPGEQDAFRDSYMEFTLQGKTQRVGYSEAEHLYGFVYGFLCRVNVAQIADDIEAKFVWGKGQEKSITYTVSDYLKYFSEHRDFFDEKTVALAEAVGDYGHYCQIVLAKENGWALGTDHRAMFALRELTEEDRAKAQEAVSSYAAEKQEEAGKLGFSVTLSSKFGLSAYLTLSGEDGEVTGQIDGVPSPVYPVEGEENTWRMHLENIPATEAGKTHVFTFAAGEKTSTLKASVLSYAQSQLDPALSHGEELTDAVTAMWRYIQAVQAYVGK